MIRDRNRTLAQEKLVNLLQECLDSEAEVLTMAGQAVCRLFRIYQVDDDRIDILRVLHGAKDLTEILSQLED